MSPVAGSFFPQCKLLKKISPFTDLFRSVSEKKSLTELRLESEKTEFEVSERHRMARLTTVDIYSTIC